MPGSGPGSSRQVGRHAWIAAGLVACAVVLGGGGSPSPLPEIVLQLIAVAAALAWLWLPGADGAPAPRPPRRAWIVAALAVAVPLVQLVPLPPALWHAADPHGDRAAALALIGRADTWQPLSHSPPRTLAALLALGPALLAFLAAAALDPRARRKLFGVIAALALCAALLGAVQVALGEPYLYPENHRSLTGFQANRNAAADVLLIGLVAATVYALDWLGPDRPARHGPSRLTAGLGLAGAAAVLATAVIATQSRTGIALSIAVLAALGLLLRPALRDLGRWQVPAGLAALAVAPVLALAGLAAGNTAVTSALERFVFADDARRELWRDAWFAAGQAWPMGVGMGAAQPALIAAERLEVLEASLPNRVHNDYLELALESGLAGLAALAAIGALLAWSARQGWRADPGERPLIAGGALIVAIAAAHSFVDYPVRSMALAVLVGTGAGLLIVPGRGDRAESPSGKPVA